MEFELTDHARQRIRQRRIQLAWIEQAVHDPDMIEPDLIDPDLEHRLAVISESGSILRVVLAVDAVPIRIVTAFFDAGLKGKL